MQLVKELMKHREMKPSPVRRVWLSKDGKPIKADRSNARPLGIPTVYDRAAQALWRLALQPIAEHMADDRSYGYRPYRGAHD
jgi:RNA-directed DNA polymerase